jgi:hypothetical protein
MVWNIFTNPLNNTQNLISRINTSNHKLSTLMSTDGMLENYSDMENSLSIFLEAEGNVNTLSMEKLNANSVLQRQNSMNALIQRASGANQQIQEFLTLARSGSGMDTSLFRARVEQFKSEMVQILNSKFQGKAIFGGVDTAGIPVNMETLTPLSDADPVSTGYYEGAEGDLYIRVDETRVVNKFPVTAEHPAFAKTLTALRMLEGISEVSSSNSSIRAAMELVNSAKDSDYPDAIVKGASASKTVKTSIDENLNQLLQAQERVASYGRKDVMETFMALKTQGASLEISQRMILEQIRAVTRLVDQ